jgi:hypothetical protein
MGTRKLHDQKEQDDVRRGPARSAMEENRHDLAGLLISCFAFPSSAGLLVGWGRC